jgi:hypothetical protein
MGRARYPREGLAAAGGEPRLAGGYMLAVAAISLLSADLLPETHRREIPPTAAADPAAASRAT